MGTTINEVYNFLKNYGSMRGKDYPYDIGVKQSDGTVPKEAYTDLPGKEYVDKMREALGCRLSEWNSYKIQGTGTAITNNKDANLDVVKILLMKGHPLIVQADCDWDIRNSRTWGYTIASCASNGDGHGMTIVGYNDDVWVDVNGNNQKDQGECGAFKVANSWGSNYGESNGGYIWVLYDALNGKSSIPGYERADGKTRVPVFGKGYADNYFMGIKVENKKVEFVAEVNFTADMLDQLLLRYYKTEKADGSVNSRDTYFFGDYSVNQPSAYNGVVLIDMGKAMDSITTDYQGYKWCLRISDRKCDKKYIHNITYNVTDNLGREIKNGGSISSIDGEMKMLAAPIDLMVGDVDYSGIIDMDDALLVQRYAVNLEEFSHVQKFIGDVNGDELVDVEDAQLIMKYSLGV